ncbi:MAG: nucleotidyl transferase AbiEii/AbiGii toxin family protein [Deltaproteobacteria bacterium]|nr:nucleotidyl transferase AbiEii/AbiGii toxin family protein [Deltaproteobacteria bacterium]
MTARTYRSPEAFKRALDDRLRASTASGPELERRRQLLVFDRFLARVAQVFGDAATLKGGMALELRLERARTTKDVDLRVVGPSNDVLARLQSVGRRDLADFMSFEVVPDVERPQIQNAGMQYDGMRFRAECKIAGRLYGQPFGVDVAFGDPIVGEPELVTAEDTLAFAGISPPTLRIYPVATHVAEKLHAYTMPRPHPNTRVKDLPDLALLGAVGALEARILRAALEQTFGFRKTHALPRMVPAPPPSWRLPFEKIARDDALPWTTIEEVTRVVRELLDPILAGDLDGTWDAAAWSWRLRNR